MFGLENAGSQLKGFVDTSVSASINEALVKIPGYAFVSQAVRKLNSREKGAKLGARADATVVDAGEMKTSKNKITKELGGTFNPIRNAWNLVRRLFGSSSGERAGAELSTLQSYAELYDSHMFANDTLKFSLKQLQRRISGKESWFSKLGLKTDDKVNKDATVQQLKQTLKTWLKPFQTMIHGGIKNIGFSKNDWEFLTSIRDQIRSGSGSKYMKDILNDFEQVLTEANKVWQEKYNTGLKQQHQAEAAERKRNSLPNSTQPALT